MTRRHISTSIGIGLVAALLPVAAIAQDGGTRSVFADGAGNRALALGGAYVAIADDASAALWNPGGLGFVPRRTAEATHTNLFGLGFSEQFAGVVLPSWRFGAASVTLRTFGVGDIDARDDRNAPLDAPLSASELELGLGFGRRLDDYWGIGGALRVQRQRVADASDLGIGIDLGVKSYLFAALGIDAGYADRTTVGLSIRNALAPRLRLDESEVTDPSVLRAGLAYTQPLGDGGRSLTWAMDLDATPGMTPRTHFGFELNPVSHLALRTGFDAGRLEAGIGAKLGTTGIDYAFEDHPLGVVHRFGVRVSFGRTTGESRRLHLLSEENALQDKLADAFDERNRAHIEQLVLDVERDLEAGETTRALENLGILKVLDPTGERLDALEAQVLLQVGLAQEAAGDIAAAVVSLRRASRLSPEDATTSTALARVRDHLASRTARSMETRELMQNALDALAGDDLAAARSHLAAILAISPEDEDARRMLARTNEAVVRRVDNLLAQSRQLAQAGLFDDANVALNRALRLSPDNRDIDDVASAIQELRNDAETAARRSEEAPAAQVSTDVAAETKPAAPSPPPRRRLTAEERRQVENMYRLGVEAADRGEIDDALRYWEFVWESDPDFGNVSEHLVREYLARGMEAFADGQLEQAVAEWENVLRIDPNDARASGYLARAREQEVRIQEIARDSRVAERDQ